MTNILPMQFIMLATENKNVMVEVKSGETYSGILKAADKFMNLKLENVVLTDSKGESFHQIKEVYVKGNTIKYINLDDDLVDKIQGTQYQCPAGWRDKNKKDFKRKQKF